MKNFKFIVSALIFAASLLSCGGGGGGSSSISGDSIWLVQAPVTQNGCGDRIAPVTQEFTLNTDGEIAIVNTSIVNAQGIKEGSNITAGYSESFGDCTRTHNMEFKNISGGSAEVFLSSQTSCASGANCTNTWTGTATESAAVKASADYRVRGENCLQPIPAAGYRPSLFECNGTAAIILRDNLRNNYSVVVRRNGENNDRDPNNPTCGTNECSPYKTQKKMELPEYQVNCLGDSGFSELYDPVLRMSIKFTALVTNANDPNQFEQYCINNVEESFN